MFENVSYLKIFPDTIFRKSIRTLFFIVFNPLGFCNLYLFIFFWLFSFSRAAPAAYGGSQASGLIGAVAAGLSQSHSNAGSEPCLQPTSQLTAMPDP